jgi:hypothetical protein
MQDAHEVEITSDDAYRDSCATACDKKRESARFAAGNIGCFACSCDGVLEDVRHSCGGGCAVILDLSRFHVRLLTLHF